LGTEDVACVIDAKHLVLIQEESVILALWHPNLVENLKTM
jgi:hypothetical protein